MGSSDAVKGAGAYTGTSGSARGLTPRSLADTSWELMSGDTFSELLPSPPLKSTEVRMATDVAADTGRLHMADGRCR